MTRTVLATVRWTDQLYKQRFNHRLSIPSDAKYCPIILFLGQKLSDDELWNAVIIFKKKNLDGSYLVELSYLSEIAPAEHLASGNKFELFDGPNKVAQGVII